MYILNFLASFQIHALLAAPVQNGLGMLSLPIHYGIGADPVEQFKSSAQNLLYECSMMIGHETADYILDDAFSKFDWPSGIPQKALRGFAKDRVLEGIQILTQAWSIFVHYEPHAAPHLKNSYLHNRSSTDSRTTGSVKIHTFRPFYLHLSASILPLHSRKRLAMQ